jgi:hypothetical protein
MPRVLERKDGPVLFEEGQVNLREGFHLGPNRGFGVTHILAEHSAELCKLGYEVSPQGVIFYVQGIFQPGAAIYCEYASMKGGHRPLIVHGQKGMLVLQPKGLSYNVVTAYFSRNPKGQLKAKL